MADAGDRLPPLYIIACILPAIGIAGLGCIFVLQLPPHIFKGFLSVFLGFIAFGTGETLNHQKTPLLTTHDGSTPESTRWRYRRNVCSLGNLCDIGALLLFFAGLASLLFPRQ